MPYFPVRVLDAQQLPFPSESLDVILIFEALYYIPSAERFVAECKRVLRPGGYLLISNANKDLSDFNPSPHSHVYHGVVELGALLAVQGFSAKFFGDVPIAEVSMRQRIPRSMAGKRLLKRLVFGNLTQFPAEIAREMLPVKLGITELEPGKPDARHKVILCAAIL
jgi:SAM-dependent methyltransferase